MEDIVFGLVLSFASLLVVFTGVVVIVSSIPCLSDRIFSYLEPAEEKDDGNKDDDTKEQNEKEVEVQKVENEKSPSLETKTIEMTVIATKAEKTEE